MDRLCRNPDKLEGPGLNLLGTVRPGMTGNTGETVGMWKLKNWKKLLETVGNGLNEKIGNLRENL